jgi:WhiB family redox-sensing transcriptional regulator
MGEPAIDDVQHRPRQAWMSEAVCKDRPHLFFPPLAERPQARVRRERRAADVCEACPVLAQCRLYARLNREYGFWGGESEEARGDAGYPVPSPIGGRARKRRLAAQLAAEPLGA